MIKKQLETKKDLNVTQEVRGLAARPASARLLEAARQTPQEVFAAYETTPQGQPRPDIMRALFGRNELARKKADSILKRLFKAFINPFTVVLIVLAVISFITDYVIVEPEDRDLTAVLIVGIMVFISGTLRFVQEVRSGNAAERLQAMVKTTIAVLRDGESRERPISELVVGDVIRLAAGDMIPADVRIVETKDLFVSQSSLTGESEPMEKWTAAQPQTGGNPLECNNLAFMGSTVVSGSALALVIAVGKDTLFGALARRVAETRVRTNFEKGVNAVSWVLIRFMVGMVPVVLFLNGFTKGDWVQAALFALSVAVGLTPEMLPMIVSANLAKGAVAMSRKKVIVKHLNAIQNLGAMNILCTDKTGTLTQDRIVLEYPLDVHGNVDERVLRHAFLNSYHQTGLRNLMDEAIVDHAYETNMLPLWQDYRKVEEIPFDFTRRRMSVVVADKAGKTQIITKGAVEEMLSICTHAEYNGQAQPLTDERRAEILSRVDSLNEDGLRVIAIAQKSSPSPVGAFGVKDECDMVLMGYLAFLDPPKESTADAIKALKAHGVTTKILTGDNDKVTRTICKQVGLKVRNMLLGADLDRMTDEELARAAETTEVFAKLTPDQKARVVTILRNAGHTVGFMGDGINDAAAMKAADIGISVDTAVDVAKESADIILLEKDLMVLEEGIIEGRKTYANMIKYIKMTASSNFGNMFSVLASSALLPFLPMESVHLIFLNLIYDLSCTAIPWDNVDEEFIAVPRKWDASSVGNFMIWIGPTSSIFDFTTYIFMYFVFCPMFVSGGVLYNDLAKQFSGAELAQMQTTYAAMFQAGWFVESMWSQTLVIHMIRTPKLPFIQSRASAPLAMLTCSGIALLTVIPFTGFGRMLGFVALPGSYFAYLIPCILLYMVLATSLKKAYVRHYGELL